MQGCIVVIVDYDTSLHSFLLVSRSCLWYDNEVETEQKIITELRISISKIEKWRNRWKIKMECRNLHR